MGRKRLVISIILSFFITVFCHPIYSGGNLFSSLKATKETKTSRIDFFAAGQAENRLEFLKSSNNLKFYSPEWYHNPQWIKLPGNGSIVEGMLKSKWQDYNLELKAVGSGDVTIFLSGPDKMHNNIRYPVLVDYKKLVVNGKVIFFKKKTQWHDRPFIYNIKVKDGEKLNVQITARRHHLRFSDFSKFYHLDYKMLFVIMVLSFLLSYKLVHYVAKFKILEHNSRIDIVFLCVFFVLLFVPMMKINSEQKSEQENRMLAKYPVFFTANGINVRFGAQFENWFNDRFGGRENYIQLLNKIKRIITGYGRYEDNKDAIYNKNENWFFTKKYNSVAMYQHNNLFSQEQLQQILNNFEKIQRWCDNHKIKLYVMLSSDKETLYKKYYPKYYKKVNKISQKQQLIKFLNENSTIKIIDPETELEKSINNGDDVYCRTGTHMNSWGAYLEYKKLITEIAQDFPDIPMIEQNKLEITQSSDCDLDILRSMNMPKYNPYKNLYKNIKLKDFKSKFVLYEDLYPEHLRAEKGYSGRFLYRNDKGKYKIFIIGDSFAGLYSDFLSYNFKELYRLFLQIQNEKNKLEIVFPKDQESLYKNKPDILVIESTERFLYRFLDMKIIPEGE